MLRCTKPGFIIISVCSNDFIFLIRAAAVINQHVNTQKHTNKQFKISYTRKYSFIDRCIKTTPQTTSYKNVYRSKYS